MKDSSDRTMTKAKRNFFAVALILISVLAVEAALRFAGTVYLKRLYVHTERGSIDPQKTNIVCLGESSTAGLDLPWQDSYPVQLNVMLKKEYPGENIQVIVPPHVGQNTSQVANRIEHYIELYSPRLVVLMVGFNNEWSLAESHIHKFLKSNNAEVLKVKILCFLDSLRTFKVLRYLYLRYVVKEKSDYVNGLREARYVWGGPELTRWPPRKWVYSFADENRQAFIALWRDDVQKIISAVQRNNIKIVLMTYHINPDYLAAEEFISMARRSKIPLVRNDETFQAFINNRTIGYFLLRDQWHPNKLGYSLIAENVFRIIKERRLLEE